MSTNALAPPGPCAALAEDYLSALLDGERDRARQLVFDAVGAGVDVRDVYLHVFEATQHRIGQMWQDGCLSVAQEHYVTAVTQWLMSQLYPQVFASARAPLRLVATAVAGNLHELGARMVADFFEMDGWDTHYLGADTPIDDVIETIVARRAHVLAISAALPGHVDHARHLIARVRGDSRCDDVSILVGGRPFREDPALWQAIGADGSAPDARAAVVVGRALVTSR